MTKTLTRYPTPTRERLSILEARLERYERLSRLAATEWERLQYERYADATEAEINDLESRAKAS